MPAISHCLEKGILVAVRTDSSGIGNSRGNAIPRIAYKAVKTAETVNKICLACCASTPN